MRFRFPGTARFAIWAIAGFLTAGSLAVAGPDSTPGQGDPGPFILREAAACGRVPANTNALLAITNSWRYSEGRFGVRIDFQRDDYAAVRSFLVQAFGKPDHKSVATNPVAMAGYWPTANSGPMQLWCDSSGARVTIIRKLTAAEVEELAAGQAEERLKSKEQNERDIQDARVLYEAGRFKEALEKLRAVRSRDPDNPAVAYYGLLIQQARERDGEGRQLVPRFYYPTYPVRPVYR
ncbi:MAG: hypothetical protein U1F98_17050 [Verrucomicrobiota bacterium]